MQTLAKLILVLLFISPTLSGQNVEIQTSINNGELKMSFPSIYFKHKATDYATMPYTVDSCFKYIALHIKDINDLVIWRDSLETEKLTNQRIKKLKTELSKYKVSGIYIKSMGKEQKISRRTIEDSTDSTQIKYLLSLNSVFDISRTKTPIKPHKGWHLPCWMNWQLDKSGREHCRMERRLLAAEQKGKKKNKRHLVWTGWKTGFHWSTTGK